MSDQKKPGGSGPYLTKDAFYVAMNEVRDRQDANKREILVELRRVSDEWKGDCEDDIDKLEKRIAVLEHATRSAKILTAGVAAFASIISTAVTASLAWLATRGGY